MVHFYLTIGLLFTVYGVIYAGIYYRMQQEQEETDTILKMKMNIYTERVKYSRQIRKLQHDMSNLLITVQQLLTMGQIKQADQLLEQYEVTLKEIESKLIKRDIPSI